ncbi:hypothetical protein PN478_09525 [Dolichospermum circinale CS-534/05]|uniref:hypothetical protein n=1 Tax=Dolichospermum circinale TaxID=109265 RepID=UPI00232F7BA1|nr:hypothetical protein [Dolichospermum circinale]MDB9454647.1 hypothetical protein [Dolichospermum circinale CS-541/06]MDB9461438.1 hypothetical protein [Dolichospermum circinale CS-541/04]MDB9490761.1 hypothetical protein [Dolichospermum circinale CS-534/05]MDB9546449.1 hypothetical protein [Dolichospermum circinale CS-1031]
MEEKRYRFNRKFGKIYLEDGKELIEVGESLKVIILWSSEAIFTKPFAHLAAQEWVQLTFIDNKSNWCYALLNGGLTNALFPWFEYQKQISNKGLDMTEVITTISLIKAGDVFDYSFSGVPGKPGLRERMDNLIKTSNHLLMDSSIDL